MDTLLTDGEHALDGRGQLCAIDGERELIQRALIRLSVRRGAFTRDPGLGSELHKLPGVRGDILERLALSYVREALAPMSEAGVQRVTAERRAHGLLMLTVDLAVRGQVYALEVEVR